MKKIIFIWVLSLIVLSSFSVNSQTVPKDTSQTTKEIFRLKAQNDTMKMEFEKVKKESYEKAMENAKANMDLASLLIKGVGLIVAIMTGLGIFSYIRAGQTREKVEKEIEEIRKLKGDANQEMNKTVSLRNDIENTKKEAENLIKEIKRIYEDVKKRGEEIEKAGKEIDEKKRSVDKSKTEVSAVSAFAEGFRLKSDRKYEESIEKFKIAASLLPNFASAYFNWGYALGELGKHEEAIEKYRKVSELTPNDAAAYNNWGWSLGELGRYKEEIEKLNKAIELAPYMPEPHNHLGLALAKLGRYEEAIKECEQALVMSPSYAGAFRNKARIYSLQKKNKEALENLKRAIELEPKYKEEAKKDKDFKNLWQDEEFKKLVE